MPLTKCTVDTAIHQSLPNQPAQTPEELKELFDKASTEIKEYINDVLTGECDTEFAARATQTYVNSKIAEALIGPVDAVTDDYLSNDSGQIKDRVNQNTDQLAAMAKYTEYKTTGGTANAQTVDTTGTFDLTKDGNILYINPSLTNTAAITIAADGQAAKAVKKFNIDTNAYVDIEAGDIKKNQQTSLRWDLTEGFFVLAPKGGANIKSIQRGTYSYLNKTTADINISEVDLTKAIVKVQILQNGFSTAHGSLISVKFLNSTTIRLQSLSARGNAFEVYWEVIEYNNVKSIQTGSTAISGTASSALRTITSIDVNKSDLFFSIRSDSSSSSISYMNVVGKVNSSTQLGFYRDLSGNSANTTVEWQIIEFN